LLLPAHRYRGRRWASTTWARKAATMRDATVAEVMTKSVIAVGPGTPFKDVIGLMADHEISAVPVIDNYHKPIGVVSEADLLTKQDYRGGGTEQPQRPQLSQCQEKWRKAHAVTARELMTCRVITVRASDPVIVAARRLAHPKVRSLFVVDAAGRLVGVVARRDLLRLFLRTDEAIRAEVARELARQVPWADRTSLDIRVDHGVVTLDGELARRSQAEIVARLTQAMPCVVEVRNNLRFHLDDMHRS
jgi:CBS domain-containing protein